MMTEELKPVRCGCGGEAKVIMLIPEVYAVECSKCWIRTGSPAKTEAEAVTAWNKAMGADKVDELMEHVWREELDTREKIAELVERMLR